MEDRVDVVQGDHADRQVELVARVDSEDGLLPLREDLEPHRRQRLGAVAEVQPLIVFFPGHPPRHELDELGTVEWPETHVLPFPAQTSQGHEEQYTRPRLETAILIALEIEKGEL